MLSVSRVNCAWTEATGQCADGGNVRKTGDERVIDGGLKGEAICIRVTFESLAFSRVLLQVRVLGSSVRTSWKGQSAVETHNF